MSKYLEVGIDQTGTSSSITGSGTANTLAMFTSANTIGNSVITQNSTGTALTFGVTGATTGVVTPFSFPQPITTGVTANTENIGFSAGGGSIQFVTGTIPVQRQAYFASTTYSGTLAPTVLTNAYGMYVEAPTAGANVTIANNWAAGFNKAVSILGTGGNGYLNLVGQNVGASQPASSGLNLFSGGAGQLSWIQKGGASTAFSGGFNLNSLSTNQMWELYDFSGDVGIFSQGFGAPSDSVGDMIFGDAATVGAMTWDGNIPFVYNSTTASLGIGIAVPTATLHIATNTVATGAKKSFLYAPAGNTNQTLSTEISAVSYALGTRQWATGALVTQREFLISAPTYSFVGASTITNAYSLFVSPPVASTNATITNIWAIGTTGNVQAAKFRITTVAGYISSDGSAGATGTFTILASTSLTIKDGIITVIV